MSLVYEQTDAPSPEFPAIKPFPFSGALVKKEEPER